MMKELKRHWPLSQGSDVRKRRGLVRRRTLQVGSWHTAALIDRARNGPLYLGLQRSAFCRSVGSGPRRCGKPKPHPGTYSAQFSGVFEMIKATLLRPGMIIKYENDLAVIYSVDHRTPGNKRGSMQTKLRNLRTGNMMDHRFRAEETVERVVVDELPFEYLYSDGDTHHFMNTENYEQLELGSDVVGDSKDYLIPNLGVKIEYYDDKPIGVLVPDTVDLTVIETEQTIQKATASAVMKPAKLETGLVVNVPPFVGNGDKIKVDTSEARYIQRVQ
jgi:elongation factor P